MQTSRICITSGHKSAATKTKYKKYDTSLEGSPNNNRPNSRFRIRISGNRVMTVNYCIDGENTTM
jgi:hypothetical protein